MDLSMLVDNWKIGALIVLAIGVALPGLWSLFGSVRTSDKLARRLERRSEDKAAHGNQNRIGKAMLGFGANATPEDAGEVSAVRAQLIQAGFLNASAVPRYYFARFMCVVIPQLALLFALPYLSGLPPVTPLAACLFLILLGLALPGMYVSRRIKARAKACRAGFPDMMDLLVACVEAGLSLDAGVLRVSEELSARHPAIAHHMKTLVLELRAGKDRRSAWRGFADRVGLEEAGSLATMLRQAEEMGTSLGDTLRVFSADMRQRRILYAEEKAMALPAKLTVPMVFFIFPVLLGVLILPAVVQFQEIMG